MLENWVYSAHAESSSSGVCASFPCSPVRAQLASRLEARCWQEARCRQTGLAPWVTITEAKFPAFEIQSALSVFNMSGSKRRNDQVRACKELCRLQKAFKCADDPSVHSQIERLRYVAARKAEGQLGLQRRVARKIRTGGHGARVAGASSSGAAKLMEFLQLDSHISHGGLAQNDELTELDVLTKRKPSQTSLG